jgi:hypothetical protein
MFENELERYLAHSTILVSPSTFLFCCFFLFIGFSPSNLQLESAASSRRISYMRRHQLSTFFRG